MGFLGSSAGKESTCNAGRDPASIPGLGSSPGEGDTHSSILGLPLVAQMVKNLPAVQETWVPSLGQEDPLEKEMAPHSSIPAWRNPHGQRSLVGYSPWVAKESNTI